MSVASSKAPPRNVGIAVTSQPSTGSGVWTVGRAEHESIAYAVHDAKGVLGALIVNVDWLRGALQGQPVAGVDAALDDIQICCQRLNGLLREALRTASGKPVRDGISSIRVSSLVARMAEVMRRQAEAHEVALDIIEGEDASVLGEQVALERVLGNLLENAIRFSRRGGCVVLSYGRENGTVFITVADEGPGVPIELQEQVFEAFQTSNNSAAEEHAGLGLAFCRKVIRQHGGDVRVSNRPVAGALFSITLPNIA